MKLTLNELNVKLDPCPICFDPYTNQSETQEKVECALNNCFHSLCFECLLKNLALSKLVCPICKSPFDHIFILFLSPCSVSAPQLEMMVSCNSEYRPSIQSHICKIFPSVSKSPSEIVLTPVQKVRREIYLYNNKSDLLPGSMETDRPPSFYANMEGNLIQKIKGFLIREAQTITLSRDVVTFVGYVISLLKRHAVGQPVFLHYVDIIFRLHPISRLFCHELRFFLRFECDSLAEFDKAYMRHHKQNPSHPLHPFHPSHDGGTADDGNSFLVSNKRGRKPKPVEAVACIDLTQAIGLQGTPCKRLKTVGVIVEKICPLAERKMGSTAGSGDFMTGKKRKEDLPAVVLRALTNEENLLDIIDLSKD